MPEGFWTVLLLLCIGYTLILFEVVIPGGVVGLVGAAIVGWGIWEAFGLGMSWGAASVVTSILVFVAFLRWIFYSDRRGLILVDQRSRLWKAPRPELQDLVGRRGRTLSALRPAGLVRFGDAPGEDRVDVVSESEFLPLGVEVEVVEVEGNRIVVAPVLAGAGEARAPEIAAEGASA